MQTHNLNKRKWPSNQRTAINGIKKLMKYKTDQWTKEDIRCKLRVMATYNKWTNMKNKRSMKKMRGFNSKISE